MKKTKLWLGVLFACFMLALLLPTEAQAVTTASGTCGDDLTWTLTDNGTLTISGTGAMTDWAYSSNVPWFYNRTEITKVVINSGVTSIGEYAFYNCDGITSLVIPDSVTGIGRYALAYCDELVKVTLSKSLADIPEYTFRSCKSLASIDIPDSVKSIGEGAFEGCTSLTSVKIGNGVQTIGAGAFLECEELASITLGTGLKTIGDNAFENCKKFVSLTLPDGLTSIGAEAFYFCSNLTSIKIPDSVTSIGEGAFRWCDKLMKATLSKGLIAIPNYMFYHCESLASVTVPESVQSIGVYAFGSCEKITSIVIPDGVQSISAYTFVGCTALTSVDLPDSVQSIGERAFSGCSALADIDIPNSVTSIGDYAFYYCPKLTRINIPDGMTSIGEGTFSNCGISGVRIPNTVISIGESAFEDCENLLVATIPNSVVSLGYRAFHNCDNLQIAIVGSGVILIESGTFSFCDSLASIIIPDSVMVIDDYAFSNSDALTTVYYTGSESQWGDVWVGSSNGSFSNAQIVFNYMGTPTLKAAANSATGRVVLTWEDVPGAKEYAVYRATSKNGDYKKVTTTSDLTYMDTSANPGTTYYYKVRGISASQNGEYSNVVSHLCTLAKPAIEVSNNESTGKIVLTWEKVTGASSYEVWRSTTKNGTYTKVYTTDGLKMLHNSAKPGETYYYKVRAVLDGNSNATSPYSNIEGRTCDLARPTGVKAANNETTGKLILTWEAVDGASRYEVWRSTEEDGTYKKVYTTTGLKMLHNSAEPGETYYYQIRAILDGKSGATSAFTKPVGRTCDLPRPTGVAASNNASTGKLILTWEAVDGANRYEVWRSTTKDGTYKKVYTTTGLKMLHNSANPGETYYYKVRAVLDGNSSAASAYTTPIGRTCDLAKPTGVTATNNASTGKIILTWEAVDGASRYEVWRSTTKDGTYKKVYTTTGLKMLHNSCNPGETYYYQVRAILDGNSSATGAFSTPIGRTCDCAKPTLTATLSGGDPKLTWGAVDGATKYELYRSTSKDGTYTKVYSGTKLTYTDTDAASGVTYYYKVRAVCKVSAGTGAYSAIKSIKAD